MTYPPKQETESNPLRNNEILMTVTLVKCKLYGRNMRTMYRLSYVRQQPQNSINESADTYQFIRY